MSDAPVPDMPLARKLAFAVIALAQLERAIQGPVPVILPGQKAEALGELLIDAGEEVLAAEPQPIYDPLLLPARERFMNMVRTAAKDLQAMAPQRPRLVRPDGGPSR